MAKDTDKGQPQTGGNVAGPDVMLGMWASWMDRMAAPAQASAGQSKPWWQMTADAATPDVLAGGVKQLEEGLAKDPTLRSIDQMWNANPLREVVPIDWAEIVRALRTVWLRSLSKPETAKAGMDFNQDLWRSALQVWQEAGQRWLGTAGSTPTKGPVSASADKRFAAPEWHTNPVYRTLKEVYLLASDWLMKQADAVDDMDEAERQRINFHLRQFVDAMSPTLILMSNPAPSTRRSRPAEPASWPAPATSLRTSTPGVSAWSTRGPSLRGATSRSRPARWSTAIASSN